MESNIDDCHYERLTMPTIDDLTDMPPPPPGLFKRLVAILLEMSGLPSTRIASRRPTITVSITVGDMRWCQSEVDTSVDRSIRWRYQSTDGNRSMHWLDVDCRVDADDVVQWYDRFVAIREKEILKRDKKASKIKKINKCETHEDGETSKKHQCKMEMIQIPQEVLENDNLKKIVEFEKIHVSDVYDEIADDFDISRGYMWPGVTAFLDKLPQDSFVLDVGCGNGKYLHGYKDRLIMTGTDFCRPLLIKAGSKCMNDYSLDLFQASCSVLPIKENTFDNAICIAVLNHFSNPKQQLHIITHILSLCKPGGSVLFTWWLRDHPSLPPFDPSPQPPFAQPHQLSSSLVSFNGKNRLYAFADLATISALIEKSTAKDYSLHADHGNAIAILYK